MPFVDIQILKTTGNGQKKIVAHPHPSIHQQNCTGNPMQCTTTNSIPYSIHSLYCACCYCCCLFHLLSSTRTIDSPSPSTCTHNLLLFTSCFSFRPAPLLHVIMMMMMKSAGSFSGWWLVATGWMMIGDDEQSNDE